MMKAKKKKQKNKRLTLREVIFLCNVLMSEDSVSETVTLNILQKRPVTDQERSMAMLINDLYRVLHPYTGCFNPHKNWAEESYEKFQPIKKDMRVRQSKEDLNNLKS